MFRTKSPSQMLLEDEIVHGLKTLKTHTPGSAEYEKTLGSLIKLYEMKNRSEPSPVSSETRATVAANLLGILMIIKHEQVNVIASKALGFVMRPK